MTPYRSFKLTRYGRRWSGETSNVRFWPIPLKNSPATRVRLKTARFQRSLKLETCGYRTLVAVRPVRNPGSRVFQQNRPKADTPILFLLTGNAVAEQRSASHCHVVMLNTQMDVAIWLAFKSFHPAGALLGMLPWGAIAGCGSVLSAMSRCARSINHIALR